MYIAIPIVEKFIEVALIKNFTNDMPCIEAKGYNWHTVFWCFSASSISTYIFKVVVLRLLGYSRLLGCKYFPPHKHSITGKLGKWGSEKVLFRKNGILISVGNYLLVNCEQIALGISWLP